MNNKEILEEYRQELIKLKESRSPIYMTDIIELMIMLVEIIQDRDEIDDDSRTTP